MKTLKELEDYALNNYIPIARKPFVEFLLDLIKQNNYSSVLEIGAAIGYTCINLAVNGVNVTTIEYNKERYDICKENIKDFNVENKIELLFGNALDLDIKGRYDLIFIDASKTKSIQFFNKFKENLNDNGLIIIDNMELKELMESANVKKVLKYQQVLKELKEYLNNLEDYKVEYNDVGDGIAILKKIYKKENL